MIVFDFDGVLFDTVDELAVSAFNRATDQLITSCDKLPQGFRKLYRLNRCRVQHAADVALLGQWCLGQCGKDSSCLLSGEEAEELFSRPPNVTKQLGAEMFVKRVEFSKKHPQQWLNLNPPYQPLWSTLCQAKGFVPIVLTYKNRDAVCKLFSSNGLDIAAEDLYSGDGGVRKDVHLHSMVKRFSPSKLYLIDDCLKNLVELSEKAPSGTEFVPLFADWGYLAPEDSQKAKALGFQVMSQEQFIAFFKHERAS